MPGKKNKSQKGVQISQQKYRELISRPKQSTLARDTRQSKIRKGKRSNPYLQTLLDPIRVTGVKVPDVTSFPSATFQSYQRAEFTITATGKFGIVVNPNLADNSCTNANLDTVNAWSDWISNSDYTVLSSIYHMYRPVSGCLRYYTTAASTNNQGEMMGCILPTKFLFTTNPSIFSPAQIADKFGAFRGRLKDGMELLWMPQDPRSRAYDLQSATIQNRVVGDNYPALCIACEGAATGTTIVAEWWFNYEAVPEEATFNLVNATAPYINSSDAEEATGVMTKIGAFGRALGEDLGSWLLDQGAIVSQEVMRSLASGAVHYATNRVGLRGGAHAPVVSY